MNLTSLVFLHSKIAFLSSTEAIHETAMSLLWSAMVCYGLSRERDPRQLYKLALLTCITK